MSNRLKELITIIILFALALSIAFISKKHVHDISKMSTNFAQILAEILAFILVLPQVIFQLTSGPHRRDIKSVFIRNFTPFYFII